jgi:hypothetical protein
MRDKTMRDETTPNEQKQRYKWGLFRVSRIALAITIELAFVILLSI